MAGNSSLIVRVRRIHPEAKLPRYAHWGPDGDLGADLYSVETTELLAGSTRAIPTGIAVELPQGFGALIEDRSGLAARGVTTLAGVIDAGYRGEIRVIMTNLSSQSVKLVKGERIAQLRLVQLFQADFEEVAELSATDRGERGFGSTGS